MIVTLCARLVVPWPCGAKLSPSVGKEITGAPGVPVPVSIIENGVAAPPAGTFSIVVAAAPLAEGV